jgi:protein-S-isoprenylcysteine O-methyltransferase Ste14
MNIMTRAWDAVFFVGLVAYVGIRGWYAHGAKREEIVDRRVDGLEKCLLGLVIPTSVLLPVVYLFTPALAFADYRLPAAAPWCGLGVMLGALWLFWRSHADLGRNWSVTLEVRRGHELVRHGVYRRVRHPMYAAIFLWCLGQGLLLPNWLAGWSALATFSLMYFLRTPREERMMCEVFGDAYRQYMAETGRLVPPIRRAGRDPSQIRPPRRS